MVFPENELLAYVRADLADGFAGYVVPSVEPVACDRWVARSLLQKAIRRGEVEYAQRALATLFLHDRRGIWRALIVIAMEDIGVANIDLIVMTVAAARDRPWRAAHGGEWPVAAWLVEQMAESIHCQAACDLLLTAINDPALADERAVALEDDLSTLAAVISDCSRSIQSRAIAVLAMGGGLAEGQQHADGYAVFDVLAHAGYSSHVVAICRMAWRSTRNEMAMLVPLVWHRWMPDEDHAVRDDVVPPVRLFGEYAVDQFTRVGGQVARAYLAGDAKMRGMLDDAGIGKHQQPRAVGDLIFLLEGSCLAHRAVWSLGDELRLPHRMMPVVPRLGPLLPAALAHMARQGEVISDLRRRHLPPPAAPRLL